MKRTSLLVALAGLLVAGLALPATAAEKEVTITGEGKCAKCALKEVDKCQNAIQVEEKGKKEKTTYYLADNKVSKEFHSNICKEAHKVTATGVVTEDHGKKILTPSKIELAKEK